MTMQTIDTDIKPTARRGAEGVTAGIAWFNTYGEVIIDARADWVTPSTEVAVSIVEVNEDDDPMIGAARMTVHNVQPYQGGVRTWVNIEWNSTLPIQATYFWGP